MNLAEVKELVEKLKEQKLSRAYLVAKKPYQWRPKGFKLRTCFGLAEILNVQDRLPVDNPYGYTDVVFTIEISKIEKWISKQKGQACASTAET